MEAMQIVTHPQTQLTPCDSPLAELEIPMINTMLTCLGSQHRKFDDLAMKLALAATRLAADPRSLTANQAAVEVWDEIRRDLWSHLQIEDGLVFSWGGARQAIPATLLETLKNEHQAIHKIVAELPALSSDQGPRTAEGRRAFARSLLALAPALDSHVARYDGLVLPSIRRALFHR